MLEIPAISLENVYVPVRAKASARGAWLDLTGDPVHMAFKAEGATPSPGDWKVAAWEPDGPDGPPTDGWRNAFCLVGPPSGVVVLTPGRWLSWVWVTDSPEAPKRPATGPFVVT